MNAYAEMFDMLEKVEDVKYTFTGRWDSFFVYAFFKRDKKVLWQC